MTHLLDTSAVLAHVRAERGANRVQQLFEGEENSILLCSVTLTELARRLRQLGASQAEAWARIDQYTQAVDEVVPVDEAVAREADRLGNAHSSRLPLVDALIASAARSRGAILVHRDAHYRGLARDLVEQLDLDESSP